MERKISRKVNQS